MNQEQMVDLAKATAAKYGLDPALVCAVCEQESGNPLLRDPKTGCEQWDPWAIRYEPGFYQHYVMPLVLDGKLHDETEARARAFSWGLMQLMGQTARETAYAGHLAALCDPKVGLDVGCRVLKRKLAAAGDDVRRGLLMWNGGANLNYPTEVLARTDKYSKT